MLTTYYPNGQQHIVENRVNGKRNGTVLIYNVSGQEINAIKYDNIQVCYISYRKNNTLHNEHGPACMFWHGDGQIYFIDYRQNDHLHKLHGPAYMLWYGDGQIYYIAYWQNGIRHNLHGPAYMLWYTLIEKIEYHHFGKLIKEYKF